MTFKLRGRPVHEFPNVARWIDACMARKAVSETATPVVKAGKQV